MSGLLRHPHAMRAVAGTALVLGIVACTAEPTELDWPDGASPRPAVEVPPDPVASPEAEATAVILGVVDAFREVEVASYADPQPPHLATRELEPYLADPQLMQTLDLLRSMNQHGIAFEGRPTWEPTVAELRLDEVPPTATVRDCVESNGWRPVFRETGEPVPGDERPDRTVEWLELKLYPEGWLVYRINVEVDAEC